MITAKAAEAALRAALLAGAMTADAAQALRGWNRLTPD